MNDVGSSSGLYCYIHTMFSTVHRAQYVVCSVWHLCLELSDPDDAIHNLWHVLASGWSLFLWLEVGGATGGT